MSDTEVPIAAPRLRSRPDVTPVPATHPFHVLAKPTGAACNLDCKYCFYLDKAELYPGGRFRMDDDTLEAYLAQVIASEPGDTVTIAWQGGEPTLMGIDFYRNAAAIAARLLPPGKSIQWTMQTNGTLLDDGWCELFCEHGYLIGLSLDGPPAMHDAYRVDKRGRPSSAQVLAAAELLAFHEVDVNILCCVHAANGEHGAEVYRYLRDDVGARYIQLIPIVEREGASVSDRSVGSEQWGRFLVDVFDEWVQRDVGSTYVLLFDWALAAWLGMDSPACIFRRTCGDAVALEHNGDVYSCDHFVEPEHLLGSVKASSLADIVSSQRQRAFGLHKEESLPEYCRSCEVRFACNGECPKNRFIETPDGEPGLNYLCAGYKRFFTHIDEPMRAMADLLRRGRPADEAMTVLAERAAAAFADADRNGPCPCGSRRKHEHCHGR